MESAALFQFPPFKMFVFRVIKAKCVNQSFMFDLRIIKAKCVNQSGSQNKSDRPYCGKSSFLICMCHSLPIVFQETNYFIQLLKLKLLSRKKKNISLKSKPNCFFSAAERSKTIMRFYLILSYHMMKFDLLGKIKKTRYSFKSIVLLKISALFQFPPHLKFNLKNGFSR